VSFSVYTEEWINLKRRELIILCCAFFYVFFVGDSNPLTCLEHKSAKK